jgi:hypothetical protein
MLSQVCNVAPCYAAQHAVAMLHSTVQVVLSDCWAWTHIDKAGRTQPGRPKKSGGIVHQVANNSSMG